MWLARRRVLSNPNVATVESASAPLVNGASASDRPQCPRGTATSRFV